MTRFLIDNLLLRAEILDWRSAERARIASLTRKYFDGLVAQIQEAAETAPRKNIISGRHFIKRTIHPIVRRWIETQEPKLRQKIANSADRSQHQIELKPASADAEWGSVAGIAAGAGLILAPLAMVPFVGTIASVTTTSFLVISTSAISLPILGGIALVGGASALSGGTLLYRYERKHRDKLAKAALTIAEHAVLGAGIPGKDVSLLGNLTHLVDAIAKERLERL